MTIAIAGGGIGGMTLALALLAAGLDDVEVYESAPAIRELGVGINLLPHGARELAELGLLDELLAVGIPTAELVFYTKRGQRIWGEPRGLAAGYLWPQISIHRGQLLGILHRAVAERLGPWHIHTGHHLARFGERREGGVWADFVDRATAVAVGRAEADLLVGCDGIHSVVRRTLHPDEGPSTWNGSTMWRGVTLGQPLHPAGSNGASQAILDARVLARELALQPSIEAAVTAYDVQRRPMTAAVVQANRQGAAERCLNLVQERAPLGFTNLADVMGPQERAAIFGDYEHTAGFDRDTLNNRPSLSVR